MAAGIKVVRAHDLGNTWIRPGRGLGYGPRFAAALVSPLSLILLGIGYWLAFVEGRALTTMPPTAS